MNRKIIAFTLILLIGFVSVRIVDPSTVQLIRAISFDNYQKWQPRAAERFPITIVDIDETSLTELGQWPWPRSVVVELIDKLSAMQPLVIGFDMVFAEADRFSAAQMADYLARQNPPVIVNKHQLMNTDAQFARMITNQNIVLGTMVSNSQQLKKEVNSPPKAQLHWNLELSRYLPILSTRIANLVQLEDAASSIGVLSLLPEVDGVVRRIPTLFNVNGQIWPAFGLELLRSGLFEDRIDVKVDQAGVDSVTVGGIILPTNPQGLTWLRFNSHQKARYVSAADVLNDRVDQQSLLGHIMLIGTSASGLLDIKVTPLAEQIPGVEVWAQWLESALFGRLLERPNYALTSELLFILLSGLLLIFLTVKASARISILVYLMLALGCIGFSWFMYSKKNLLFDASFPVMATAAMFACLMLMKFWGEEQKRRQIKNAFSHYLSPVIVEELAADPQQLKLGGDRREITSVFTDLQGFTELSERFDPEELIDVINRYLDGICQIVIDHDGTIDKIIGDAIHAMFGAPKWDSGHADSAVSCALEIDKFCRQLNKNSNEKFKFGDTRIGVNSGFAVVGNFGGKQRFDYTAYGDAINTAARLESANQYLGTTICVSESTQRLCQNHVFRPVADLTVKGKSESLMVYEPLASNSAVYSYLEKYSEIFFGLKNQAEVAVTELRKLGDEFPNDRVIARLLDNINQSNTIGVKRILFEK